jgi:hypothetical protein
MADEIWILESEPIQVSFDTKGYMFYKGGRGILGSPIESYLRLVAVKGEDKIEILIVSDLKERVVIKSPDEALEFVRLFTSIETHFLFKDIHSIEPRVADDAPGIGEYTEEYERRMGLEPVRSSVEGDSFVIERNLVDNERKLFRAIERVGQDGAYSLETTRTIDAESPIIYPIYQ